MPQLSFHTSMGGLTVSEEDGALISVSWGQGQDGNRDQNQESTAVLASARDQIQAYLEGHRTCFDLPLNAIGTAFQKRVWSAMNEIPYGAVQTYGEVARQIGSGARPVGTACGANPLPIIIPCHRVVAAGGGLGGYSAGCGLDTKRALLALEERDI